METKRFDRSEGSLAYTDWGGRGELVLMFPGMGALRSEYRYLAPELARAGYHAIAVDLRGHGDSSVPWPSYDVSALGGDVLALVEHLGEGPAHLVCTSKAAAAGVWAAAEKPERVRSLVLIGPFARDIRVTATERAIFWLLVHNPWHLGAWIAYYRTLYPSRKPPDFDAYLRSLTESLHEPGRFEAAMAVGKAPLGPSDVRLDRVRAPTLVIIGSEDPDFTSPIAEGEELARRTRGRLEVIRGAGHYPQTEVPERTTPVIVDFLARVAEKAAAESRPPAPAPAPPA
jgi:pimeloyl-ACP methyl ester carboxylesterase